MIPEGVFAFIIYLVFGKSMGGYMSAPCLTNSVSQLEAADFSGFITQLNQCYPFKAAF